MIRVLTAAIPAVVVAAPAWADHGGGLTGPAANPIFTALLWAGGALLVGMAVIAIATILSRRRSSPPPDA